MEASDSLESWSLCDKTSNSISTFYQVSHRRDSTMEKYTIVVFPLKSLTRKGHWTNNAIWWKICLKPIKELRKLNGETYTCFPPPQRLIKNTILLLNASVDVPHKPAYWPLVFALCTFKRNCKLWAPFETNPKSFLPPAKCNELSRFFKSTLNALYLKKRNSMANERAMVSI